MTCRIGSFAVKTAAFTASAMVAIALTGAPHAFAQQPSTRPALPAAPVARGDTAQSGHQKVDLIATPWRRYCGKGLTESSEVTTREVCFTASDGHLASGQKFVIALLIESERTNTKVLRVTVPLGVALVPGVRIVIDEKVVRTAPYVVCLAKNGCMADYKADAKLIDKLKKGQTLAIQASNKGKTISFTLPLAGFAKAYDGPPSDPTGLNELREGLPNELQSRSQDQSVTPNGK